MQPCSGCITAPLLPDNTISRSQGNWGSGAFWEPLARRRRQGSCVKGVEMAEMFTITTRIRRSSMHHGRDRRV